MGSTQKKKVLALLRASTKQQDMETQQSNVEFYCLPDNFNLEVVDTFTFPGITGTQVQKTTEFQRMQKRLESPEISGVVMSEISRMMRVDELDAFYALKVFRTHKKLIYCDVNHPLDVRNEDDRKSISDKLQ